MADIVNTLPSLIEEAIRNDEIQMGARGAGLSDDYLKEHINSKKDIILAIASDEIANLSNLKRILETKRSFIRTFLREGINNIYNFRIISPIIVLITIIYQTYWISPSRVPTGNPSNISNNYILYFHQFNIDLINKMMLILTTSVILIYALKDFPNIFDEHTNYKKSIKDLEMKIKLAETAVHKAIIEKGIFPELRSLINKYSEENYKISIEPLLSPGLSEVFDPKYEIPTKAKEEMNRSLNSMPGGSIGIAGPRGSGKTTLIWSFCSSSFARIKNLPLVALMTTAPIEYDAREFILHLFSLLCLQVIKLNDKKILSFWDYIDSLKSPRTESSILSSNTSRILVPIFSIFGIFLILIGLIITREIVFNGSYMLIIDILDIKPGSLFLGGLILLFFDLLIFSFSRPSGNYRGRSDQNDNMIVRDGRRWLKQIKFQQSYSSSLTGSLKLPIAFEGEMKSEVSIEEVQLSLPEIVEGYRSFLEQVSMQYAVVIGIDELDKLRSNEEAQSFLNDIKAIFGLERVFYLISVSENAMSSFERRGLPFRDAFDSAFDKIIYVNYLNLEGAKQLIKRRVIGIPTPFLCVCYCLSGGLARDLIRFCRDMLDVVQLSPKENNLSKICENVVLADLRSKLRAISFAAKEIWLEPDITVFFEELYQIENQLNKSPFDLKLIRLSKSTGTNIEKEESEDTKTKRARIAMLREELSTYIFYALTLLEFFNDNVSIETLKEAEKSGMLDELARGRQFLSMNPSVSWSIITAFRKRYNLGTF